jgi:hypothetical protein
LKVADPDAWNVHRAPSQGDPDGKYGGNEGADGYRIEIASVKAVITPLRAERRQDREAEREVPTEGPRLIARIGREARPAAASAAGQRGP